MYPTFADGIRTNTYFLHLLGSVSPALFQIDSYYRFNVLCTVLELTLNR
jgi:hypothetical protein